MAVLADANSPAHAVSTAADTPAILGGSAPPKRGKGPVRGAQTERDKEATPEDVTGLSHGLSDDEIQAIISAELDDAIQFVDSDVADSRTKAAEYYRGVMNDVVLEDGRSQVVHRVVHDVVMQILPSLVEVFLGSERFVTFTANKPGKEAEADQRTDYINHIIKHDNNGFELILAACKDALIRRTGIFKWAWDDRLEITRQIYEGLTADQVHELAADPDVTDMAVAQTGMIEIPYDPDDDDAIGLTELGDMHPKQVGPGAPAAPPTEGTPPQQTPSAAEPTEGQGPPATTAPAGLLASPPEAPGGGASVIHAPTYTVHLRRESKRNKVAIYCVPGEEFLRSRASRSRDESNVIGHRSLQTRSDLIAMGIDPDLIDEHSGSDGAFGFYLNTEAMDREPDITSRVNANEALAKTLYVESYIRLDRDGDGIAELYKVCTLGWQHFIVDIEDATEIPFSVLCPNPEPHTFDGESPADDTMDLQRIMSMILRSTLDSLALAIHPRMVANPNKVTIADVLNTEIGAVIRADDPTQVTALTVPFVGQSGLTMFDRLEQVVQSRTGMLAPPDAKDLQSTTKKGIDVTERQSTQRITMIARVFAEIGFKQLYMGVQRLVMQHQDVPRTVKLRGKWVTVDPSTWDSEMDVSVSVGLGQGTKEERIGALQAVLAEMKEIFATQGPANPIVTPKQYRGVLARITQLMGYQDDDEFWQDVPADWQPPAPQADAATLLAQAQAQQIAAQVKIEEGKLALEREKMMLEDERERFKIEMDMQTRITVASITATKDANATHTDAITRMAEVAAEAQIRAHEAVTNAHAQVATSAIQAAATPEAEPTATAASEATA